MVWNSQYQPKITISAKYHNIIDIWQYKPNITISAKYHNFSQISQITISAKFHNLRQKHLLQFLTQVVPPGHPFLLSPHFCENRKMFLNVLKYIIYTIICFLTNIGFPNWGEGGPWNGKSSHIFPFCSTAVGAVI